MSAGKESKLPPPDPSVSQLNCLFTARVGWTALFTAGVFAIYGIITSGVEKISDDFIKNHMIQFQVSLLFLIVGFFALSLCLYFYGLSGLFIDTLGHVSLYLLYAGVVVWCVLLFAHNSKGLEISLNLIFLLGPILVLLVMLGFTKLHLTHEEEKIRVLFEPILQSINHILSTYKDGDPLADEDHQYILVNVFNHHPQKVSRFVGRIKHFMVGQHPLVKGTRTFFVVSTEGKKENFSHLTCLKNFAKDKFPEKLVDAYFERIEPSGPKHKGGTAGHIATPKSPPSKKPDAKTAANRSNQKRPMDHASKSDQKRPSKKPGAANKSDQKNEGKRRCSTP